MKNRQAIIVKGQSAPCKLQKRHHEDSSCSPSIQEFHKLPILRSGSLNSNLEPWRFRFPP